MTDSSRPIALDAALPLKRPTMPGGAARLIVAGVLALATLLCPAAGQAAQVLLVLSDRGGAYEAFAASFRQALARHSSASIEVIAAAELGAYPSDTAAIVAVGSRAADSLAARPPRKPALLAMLPRTSVERLQAQLGDAGAVFIDQPPSRYMNLIRAALPGVDRVGLLSGRDSRATVPALAAAAREARLKALSESIEVETDIYPAIQRLFAEGGALLALPDSTVFNSQTIPSILLSAYRRNVPVVGFSPAYVAAGAVVALYSTPEQLATQSAELISASISAGTPLPAPQYPRYYSIGSNSRVARSLGIALDSDAHIRERLERLERQP